MVVNASFATASNRRNGPDRSNIKSFSNGHRTTISTPNALLYNVPHMHNSDLKDLQILMDCTKHTLSLLVVF